MNEVMDKEMLAAFNEARPSLDRLFEMAIEHSSGGPRRIADFLLAWWNARDYGSFDFTEFWSLDRRIIDDCLIVLRFVAHNKTYLDELPEYKEKFKRVHAIWREPVKTKKRK